MLTALFRRAPRSILLAAILLFLAATSASAQVDPVQIFTLPGEQNWTAIPGQAQMDQDPGDEIVVVFEESRVVIVDAATGAIEWDSDAYGWTYAFAPGWGREKTDNYYSNHGYRVFCDEDGDGIFCLNLIVSVSSPYENQLAVVCLDRSAVAAPSAPERTGFSLGRNVPNPVTTTTRIGFSAPTAGPAVLRVFDVQGRLVRTLLDGAVAAGEQSIVWDGRNDAGRAVGAGTYFYELEIAGARAARKAIVLQ